MKVKAVKMKIFTITKTFAVNLVIELLRKSILRPMVVTETTRQRWTSKNYFQHLPSSS